MSTPKALAGVVMLLIFALTALMWLTGNTPYQQQQKADSANSNGISSLNTTTTTETTNTLAARYARNVTYSVDSNHRYYRIQPGDTMSQLAEAFGVSMKAIQKLNKMSNTAIFAGQTIEIPF